MKVLLLTAFTIPIVLGIICTRIWAKRREHGTIATRLAKYVLRPSESAPPKTLLKRQKSSTITVSKQFLFQPPSLNHLKELLTEAGVGDHLFSFLMLLVVLLLSPIILASVFGFNLYLSIAAGLIFCVLAFIILKALAEELRNKFSEQLPDAIDLMVAILRSGHSISQAVRAVAQEIPDPCGKEFEAILQRINLGQPLSQSLVFSAKHFQSYELDLIRRAVAIQSEVGGSLAELLDKTNSTLRQRLKLVRQLKVVTAQSRLSAQIIGALPIVLAVALNFISPGYLQLLIEDRFGQTLLWLALSLELIGIFVMKRMSTMKV